MSLTQVHKKSLVDSVIAQLRATIESGGWSVGERIPVEPELAERLGVSRNTVREAVRVLAHAGMLDTCQGTGTFVRAATDPAETLRKIDRSALLERVEVRLILEAEAARYAAIRHTAGDRATMRAALDDRLTRPAEDTPTSTVALEAFITADARFHAAVVAAAHNSALMDLYEYFAAAIFETIRQTELDGDLPEPSQADHEALFDAIVAKDPDAAAAATRHLFTGTIAALGKAKYATSPHAKAGSY